jgi:Protein of unknown function (DUF2934)
MLLLEFVKPLLQLTICKEYLMARKTTTGTGTPRKKKAVAASQPIVAEEIKAQAPVEVPKKVAAAQAPAKKAFVSLDEEIRRRAYELFLQRNGAAGDPNHDWLIAEREVRARHTGKEQTSAMAAAQGR